MEPTNGTTATVRIAETHISILIFAGDKVYKIRKPVHFDFLDFTDRRDRAADCHREVDLNRRLSPDVYLGVADLIMDGEPLDHMVVMRSLPEERQLASLLRSDTAIETWLEPVAATLSSFHARAARSAEISASASPSALAHKWEENFEEVAHLINSTLDPAVEAEIRGLVARWLTSHHALLETRITEGHICDGHGDLQASDIFCLDDGVRILDCLEFSDALRWDDVCADVAFLAMDLERLGRPDAARMFVRAYERHSGARLPPSLLHLHIALRAYVRAKVACLRSEQSAVAAGLRARSAGAGPQAPAQCPVSTSACWWAPWHREKYARRRIGRRDRLGSRALRRGPATTTIGYPIVTRPKPSLPCTRNFSGLLENISSRASRSFSMHPGSAPNNVPGPSRSHRRLRTELLAICCTCEKLVGADRIRRRLTRGDDVSEATVSRTRCDGNANGPLAFGNHHRHLGGRGVRQPRNRTTQAGTVTSGQPRIHRPEPAGSWSRDLGPRPSGPFSLAPRTSFGVQ